MNDRPNAPRNVGKSHPYNKPRNNLKNLVSEALTASAASQTTSRGGEYTASHTVNLAGSSCLVHPQAVRPVLYCVLIVLCMLRNLEGAIEMTVNVPLITSAVLSEVGRGSQRTVLVDN